MPISSPAIVVRDLHMDFGDAEGATLSVLAGIDLEIRSGEFVSLIGPSGCGKSTLLQILGGLLQPTSGSVEIDRSNLAYVFQRPLLLPWKSVVENVAFALECRGEKGPAVRDAALDLLDTMGLADFSEFAPHEISQGMQQRVDLARALLVRPRILLMDEPFASLDVETRAAMHAELLSRWDAAGFTVVFVSHDLDEVARLSDRVGFLSRPPTTIRDVVNIDLPRPRASDKTSRADLLQQVEVLTDRFPT